LLRACFGAFLSGRLRGRRYAAACASSLPPPRGRLLRACFGAVLVALTLAGCPSPPPPIVSVEHLGRAKTFSSPKELLQQTLAKNDGYGTLTTIHKVTLEIAIQGDRSEKRAFRAALAIRRPGHFRLQILGPMGVKLVDLLYVRGEVKVLTVDRALQRSSRLPEILESVAGDIRAMYRLDPVPEIDRRRADESVTLATGRTPLYNLREYRRGELVRQMDIFAATLAIARSQVVRGVDIRTITYGGYETNGKLMIPKRIHVAKEGSVFYWLSIQVESVTIDESLDEELFIANET
jgi:hypothetical protein